MLCKCLIILLYHYSDMMLNIQIQTEKNSVE